MSLDKENDDGEDKKRDERKDFRWDRRRTAQYLYHAEKDMECSMKEDLVEIEEMKK